MINFTQVSVANRDIFIKTQGALNGDVATVAALIVWNDDKAPIEDLSISDLFISGNHLATGNLKATNCYYDELTGFYWFDVKLKPVTGPTDIVLQTSATLNGVQFPVRFEFTLQGPSPLIVSPISFNGGVMEFDVSASAGRLLRYPLGILASREINGDAKATPSRDKKIPYAFYTPINNGTKETYAVMGQAEVNGVKHNWVARTTVETNNGEMTVQQLNGKRLSVDITLEKPSSHLGIRLPVEFQFDNGTYGIANQIEAFSVVDNKVYFELPISDVKEEDIVSIRFNLTEADKQFAPIFFDGNTTVKRWSNGQTEINIVVDSHEYKKNLQSLYMSVYWKDGKPVTGFKVKNVKPDAEVGGRGNRIIICRALTPDTYHKNTLTLSGDVDLSAFGIPDLVPFSESIEVGSDILPARLMAGLGTVDKDQVLIHLSVRQNNGDLFKDVEITSFNGITDIKDTHYDAVQGIINFSVPNTAVKVVDERAAVDMSFSLRDDTNKYVFKYKGAIKVDVPYQVNVEPPVWKYRRDPDTQQVYIDATWVWKGNDGNYPSYVSLTQLRLNGSDAQFTKQYNQSFGALSVSIPVDLKHNATLYIGGVATASGLGNFVDLPPIDTRYRDPGKAIYLSHEFIGNQLLVTFDIQGWNATPPHEVQLDDVSWNKQKGVKLGKTYSMYDNTTGKLIVAFDLYDKDSPVFEASTTLKFDLADTTVYPISFSITK